MVAYHAPVMSWGQCVWNGMDTVNMFPESPLFQTTCLAFISLSETLTYACPMVVISGDREISILAFLESV